MNDKLRECPFCGEVPKVWNDVLDYAKCENNKCFMSKSFRSGIFLHDWNTRSINTPKHETVEEEMKCPKCSSDMKEYLNSYWCRNLECRIKIKKYFAVSKPEIEG